MNVLLTSLEGGTEPNGAVTVERNKGAIEFRKAYTISEAATGQTHLFSCPFIEAQKPLSIQF
jgi:hypothetical protein